MIRRLVGHVVEAEGALLTLDVHGVGYEIHATLRDGARWRAAEGPVTVCVHTEVREDAITLFGFDHPVDRAVFLKLRGVSGVGPTTALGALDALGREGLIRAVAQDDLAALTRIPKVGKTLAARLALELKGKLPDAAPSTTPVAPLAPPDLLDAALLKLGYQRPEIERARAGLALDGVSADAPIADRLRAALRILSSP